MHPDPGFESKFKQFTERLLNKMPNGSHNSGLQIRAFEITVSFVSEEGSSTLTYQNKGKCCQVIGLTKFVRSLGSFESQVESCSR